MKSIVADNPAAVTRASRPSRAAARPTAGRAPESPTTLVIGYGNTLRRDDGVGPAVVDQLAAALGPAHTCACLTVHQLTPELAEPVSRAQHVIFIDATVQLPTGHVSVRPVAAETVESPRLGHHMTPELILAMTQAVYGRVPQAWLIGIGVGSIAAGEDLTPRVAQAAGRLARHLAHRVESWSRNTVAH